MPRPRLLLIEDDRSVTDALVPVLEEEGYETLGEADGVRGLERALREPLDVVLTDLRLPGHDGLTVVRQLHSERPRLPILLMTAHGTTETAIEAMKLGAFDYVLKPFELPELLDLLRKAVEARRSMTEPVGLGEAAPAGTALVGQSRAMQAVFKEIGRLAAKPVSVLVEGETGTGKELIARALYQHSDRSQQAFVAVHCAAIPETLLESELFGHERGAFTGAEVRRIGRFEQASGGTLFLDEIGDLPTATQIKLLRVLQERTLQRLGGRETVAVDVRVISATHRDLELLRGRGEFREDLYHRLAVAVIRLPALRERLEDLPMLVQHFTRRHGPELGENHAVFREDAMNRLRQHAWPGNVRELENVVRKALLRAQGYPVGREHIEAVLAPLPERQEEAGAQGLKALAAEFLDDAAEGRLTDAHARLIARAEGEIVRQAFQRSGGNVTLAARWLGISRVTLREKLRQFGIR